MTDTSTTTVRALHDLGAASWFGGSLMGALGLNGASGDVSDPRERARIASSGWGRWSPVAAGSIAVYLVGGAGLLVANRDRVRGQAGAGTNTLVKSALTAAAIGTTAWSGALGARLAQQPPEPADSGAVPNAATPRPTARIQQQLRVLQWVTPVLTGALVVLGAQQGEQQRPAALAAGTAKQAARRLRDTVTR
jgi:hypothetical protein